MAEMERVLLVFKRVLNTDSSISPCRWTYVCKNSPGLPTKDNFDGYVKVVLEDCDNDFLSFMTRYLREPQCEGWCVPYTLAQIS